MTTTSDETGMRLGIVRHAMKTAMECLFRVVRKPRELATMTQAIHAKDRRVLVHTLRKRLRSWLMVTAFLLSCIHLPLGFLGHLQNKRTQSFTHSPTPRPHVTRPADQDPFAFFVAMLSHPAVGARHLVHAGMTSQRP